MTYRTYATPTGYNLPKQAFPRFGYDVSANLWLPARMGKNAAVLAGPASFSGDFGALAVALGLNPVGYWRGDLGLSKTGSVVNTWANQITGGTAFGNILEGASTVGVGNTAAGVGLRPSVLSNGTTQYGKTVTVPQPLAAPATTPLAYYAVMRSPVLPGANAFYIGNSFSFAVLQLNGTTNIEQYNGTGQATTLVTNNWGRLAAAFSGSASDFMQWGVNKQTGASSGNGVGSNNPLGIHASYDGTLPGNFDSALILALHATPAALAAAMPALDAAVDIWFGAGNVLH